MFCQNIARFAWGKAFYLVFLAILTFITLFIVHRRNISQDEPVSGIFNEEMLLPNIEVRKNSPMENIVENGDIMPVEEEPHQEEEEEEEEEQWTIDKMIDYEKCPSPFRVTMAAPYKRQGADYSVQTMALYNAIRQSNYYTEMREQACLTVHLASGQDGENFHQMEEGGRNRMVIFTQGIIPTRGRHNQKAIFVASQFGKNQFHPDLDMRLETDVIEFDEKIWEKLPNIGKNWTGLISCDLLPENVDGPAICGDKAKTAIPSKALATLILTNSAKLPSLINQALSAGSIPFLLGGPNPNGAPNLPFAHWIRWERALVWVPEGRADQIEAILEGIVGRGKWWMLRRNGRFVLEHYLGNSKVFIRSLFSDIRLRLGLLAPKEAIVNLPQLFFIPSANQTGNDLDDGEDGGGNSAVLMEDSDYLWNQNPTYLDANPFGFPLASPSSGGQWTDGGNEKFTIIMSSFRRDTKLQFSIRRLNGLRPYLDRILIIWNDIERMPSADIFPLIDVPIYVLNGTRNSLNTRLLPLAQIRTEAVLILDDDIDIGDNFGQKLLFSFRVWQRNRHSIVGPIFRLGLNNYQGSPQCTFNMVLTDISFLHRAYLRAYSQEMSPAIRAHVDTQMNCEDIAMNFVVGHFSRQSPVKTLDIQNVRDLIIPEGKDGHKGLAARGDHYIVRSECVQLFTRIFGYNPNIVNHYRVDPLWDGEKGEACLTGRN